MADLSQLVQRLEAAVGRLEKLTPGGSTAASNGSSGGAASGATVQSLDSFDELISAQLLPWAEKSKHVGDIVAEQVPRDCPAALEVGDSCVPPPSIPPKKIKRQSW